MSEKLLLNKKTKRKNDHCQNENKEKIHDKDSEGVKSTNETSSKNEKSKIFKKKRKSLFITNNLKIDKKNILINEKNYKINEINNEKIVKNNRLLENINSNSNSNSNISEKDNQQSELNTIIQKGFHDFKIFHPWHLFFHFICLLFIKENKVENEFTEHYSFYIYNNFKGLIMEKGYEKIKNLLTNNELLNRELNLFFLEREKEIKKASEKHQSKQIGKNSIYEIDKNNDNYLSENNQLEILGAAAIICLQEKEENELKIFKEGNNLANNISIINDLVFDISKFHLNENSIMSVLSGIMSNNNITELDLSENNFNIRSSYWLGKIINTNKNLKRLELRNCNLDNSCLSMLIEGIKSDEKSLSNDQHGLEKLSLKDNNKITDTCNEENQICETLKIFKLKSLNLTNIQLGNNGIKKLFKTYIDLLNQNKAYLETIMMINNGFKNEECLKCIGEALELPNCTIKTLILSKNLITTITDNDNNNNINYFENLMKSIGKNIGLKELYLIGCGIGENKKDVDILYNMLCENKYLASIRLFNNLFNQFSDFRRIIEVFSDHKNNLKNSSMKILDLSKNGCDLIIDDDFLDLIDRLKLEYLDISQNKFKSEEKERFRDRVNALQDIKIIY